MDEAALVAELVSAHGVHTIVLYGSRAKGTRRPGSDIDLTLCGGGLDRTLLARIENDLDDLLLPYQMDLALFLI